MSKNNKILNVFDQISYVNNPINSLDNNTCDDFDEFIPQIINKEYRKDICPDCECPMSKTSNGTSYICYICGMIEDIIGNEVEVIANEKSATSADILSSYNTSDSSAAPVKIIGPNHYAYQKKLISKTSNYEKTRKKATISQLTNCIYQCKNSVPNINVVLEAAEYYHTVQQKHIIKRGDVRKGILAACLYRKCMVHKIDRKPKEIADIIGIPQNKLSDGEKILDDLIARGIIKPIIIRELKSDIMNTERVESFLNRYFNALNIPIDDVNGPEKLENNRTNYKKFAMRLIKFTCKYKIASNSVESSKCAGVIYILAFSKKEMGVKKDSIGSVCNISKSTFTRFYKAVFEVIKSTDPKLNLVKKRLIHIFNKFDIPII